MRSILFFIVLTGTAFTIISKIESNLFKRQNYLTPKDINLNVDDIRSTIHKLDFDIVSTDKMSLQKVSRQLHNELSNIDFINQWTPENEKETIITADNGNIDLKNSRNEFVIEFAQNHQIRVAKLKSDILEGLLLVLVESKDKIEFNRQLYLLGMDKRSCITGIAEIAYAYNIDGEIVQQSTKHSDRGCFVSYYSMSDQQIEFCITPNGHFASTE